MTVSFANPLDPLLGPAEGCSLGTQVVAASKEDLVGAWKNIRMRKPVYQHWFERSRVIKRDALIVLPQLSSHYAEFHGIFNTEICSPLHKCVRKIEWLAVF
jgi:hypothetical protein